MSPENVAALVALLAVLEASDSSGARAHARLLRTRYAAVLT